MELVTRVVVTHESKQIPVFTEDEKSVVKLIAGGYKLNQKAAKVMNALSWFGFGVFMLCSVIIAVIHVPSVAMVAGVPLIFFAAGKVFQLRAERYDHKMQKYILHLMPSDPDRDGSSDIQVDMGDININ